MEGYAAGSRGGSVQVCWFGCDAGCGGCRGRLIASYILVTLVVVVLVEAVVLGFQVPSW